VALTKVGKEGITGISNSSDATAITIDSSERVGIGTSVNSLFNAVGGVAKLAVTGESSSTNILGNTDASIAIINTDQTANNTAGLHFARADTDDTPNYAGASIVAQFPDAQVTGQYPKGELAFLTSTTANAAPSEKMRIDAAGVLSVGGTNATAKFNVVGQGGSNVQVQNNIATGTGGMVQIGFINDNGLVGSIQTSGSATSYVTSSDYRLKENISYNWEATTRLKQLKPARFNFIADADTTVDGFLAHEAQAVVPESVTGTKDEVDDDGNPVMQGIDQSKIVPLLVKSLQEAITMIEMLETKVQALEDA